MKTADFIKRLEYHERVMRELHGIKAARPFKAALDAAKAEVDSIENTKSVASGDWSRVTGAAPVAENGRDGWNPQ